MVGHTKYESTQPRLATTRVTLYPLSLANVILCSFGIESGRLLCWALLDGIASSLIFIAEPPVSLLPPQEQTQLADIAIFPFALEGGGTA